MYFDNIWFLAPAALTRIDAIPSVSAAAGVLLTPNAAQFVGVRWSGKFMSPSASAEVFTISAIADVCVVVEEGRLKRC